MTFQPPLSHERSMKFNIFQFMSHILAEQPHLGIAIFNNNSVSALAGLQRRITLLHALDERQKLMLVPLEIQIASQQQATGSHTARYNRSPSTSMLYAFTPGTADATSPHVGSAFIHIPLTPSSLPHIEKALGFEIDMSHRTNHGTILDG